MAEISRVSSTARPALDHIIILIPHKDLEELPTSIKNAFTICPGGTHADNLTRNELILLQSGVYLELIAFTPGATEDENSGRAKHWWGSKSEGSVIDWALTTDGDAEDIARILGEEAEAKMYKSSQRGGRPVDTSRIRLFDDADTEERMVQWDVTFPKDGTERGSIPFWCHDITPRKWRVPIDAEGGRLIRHPCGAEAVRSISIIADSQRMQEIRERYDSLFGISREQPLPNSGVSYRWEVDQPAENFKGEGEGALIVLEAAKTTEDEDVLKRNGGVAGVKEIVLRCRGPVGYDGFRGSIDASLSDGSKLKLGVLRRK